MCRVTSVGNRESHIFVISEEVSLPKMSPKTLSTQSKNALCPPTCRTGGTCGFIAGGEE